jgi:hypothetical protein
MKKKPTTKRRSTIGDNPLDALVPVQAAASASKRGLEPATTPAKPRFEYGSMRTGGTLGATEKTTPPGRVQKARFTFHLPEDLMERAKNVAFWSSPRVTLASMAEAGLRAEVERMEKKNGGAFKGRERELVGGRPIGT